MRVTVKIQFLDLYAQHKEINKEINAAINKVIKKSNFILGEDLRLFEKEFAKFCHTRFAVGVSSGTDALFLALLSMGIGSGDEVIVPVFTFIATANAVSYTGAKPVFVDVDSQTYCLNPEKIKRAITKRTKAIIVVHLFGHPADMDPILDIAKKYNLKVIEDAAQAHGAIYNYRGLRKKVGSIGDIGCFSFYPTKNLGAFGDAGAIVTDNKTIYEKLLILRDCGRVSKYEHKILGFNARLDTLQAAILRVKLKKLNIWNRLRRQKAKLYTKLLSDIKAVIPPKEKKNVKHVYHLYVIRVRNREKLCQILSNYRIPFFIHYPIPLHLQAAYRNLRGKKGDFPVAERVSEEIVSLPMYPLLKEAQIRYIAKLIKGFLRNKF